jgi:hypothetical protein
MGADLGAGMRFSSITELVMSCLDVEEKSIQLKNAKYSAEIYFQSKESS